MHIPSHLMCKRQDIEGDCCTVPFRNPHDVCQLQNSSAVSSLEENMTQEGNKVSADTSQVQIAWRLSRANVDCLAFVVGVGCHMRFTYSVQRCFIRLFYLLSQCISNVLESKNQAHISTTKPLFFMSIVDGGNYPTVSVI